MLPLQMPHQGVSTKLSPFPSLCWDTVSGVLTHQHVLKPITRKDLPLIRKIEKYSLSASSIDGQRLCFAQKVEFTTGEKHEKDYR